MRKARSEYSWQYATGGPTTGLVNRESCYLERLVDGFFRVVRAASVG